MQLENVVNKFGSLRETVPKFKPGTIQHADEINSQRIEDTELRDNYFYTADFPLYRLERGKPVLRLARENNNLIFQNLDTAVDQLLENGNYVPEKEAVTKVVRSRTTLKIELGKLRLRKLDEEFSFLEINTGDYKVIDSVGDRHQMNAEEKKLAERVYGSMKKDFEEEPSKFEAYMKLLNDDGNGIEKTRVYVLNPEYVKKTIKELEASERKKVPGIARAGWLVGFDDGSGFYAGDRSVDGHDSLRGVPLGETPQASPEKIEELKPEIKYQDAFNVVLSKSDELNDTRTSQLLDLVAGHYRK